MSANVTVSGSAGFSVRRGRLAMSDLEQIKKNERDRKKRLRLKQVRQQSREIFSRVLDRAKSVKRNELNKMEKHERDKEIMRIHQRYQQAAEDINLAQTLAIQNEARLKELKEKKEEEKKINRQMALQRGKEAMQLLKETKKEDPHVTVQERLRKVREIENDRAAMVAQLPQKSTMTNIEETSDFSDDLSDQSSRETLSKKSQKSISKKSPIKVVSKPNVKVVRTKPRTKVLKAMVHRQDDDSVPSATATSTGPTKPSETNAAKYVSDIDEPRQSVPVSQAANSLPGKVVKYNPADYKQSTSETSSTASSSSSVSDDSSYFTDNGFEIYDPTRSLTRRPLQTSSDNVQICKHNNRQRGVPDRQEGLVEHIDMKNMPTAEDLAHDLAKVEEARQMLFEKQKQKQQNTKDSAARTRSNFEALVRNMDEYTRQERKSKAKNLSKGPSVNALIPPSRKKELLAQRQKKMNRTFESLRSLGETSVPTERPITITPRSNLEHAPLGSDWTVPPSFAECSSKSSDEESEGTNVGQLLDMLKTVDMQKWKIMKELGANLPESILNLVSRKTCCEPQRKKKICCNATEHFEEPQVTVIDVSCKEDIPATKKKETAVQTSTAAFDKGVQVEIARSGGKKCRTKTEMVESRTKVQTPEEPPKIETEIRPKVSEQSCKGTCASSTPIVHVITPGNADSSTSSTSVSSYVSSDGTDVMINVAEEQITVTSVKDKESGLKVTKTPGRRNNSPVRINIEKESRDGTSSVVSSLVIDMEKKEIRLMPKTTSSKKCVQQMPKSTPGSRSSSSSKKSSKSSGISVENPKKPTPSIQNVIKSPKKAVAAVQTTPNISTERKQEASDASTTYKSPPTPKPDAAPRKMNNSTPILEMLDSSANESTKSKPRVMVSPVSTPETPSPRTMRLPSNVRRDRRTLRFANASNSRPNEKPTSKTQKPVQSEVPMTISQAKPTASQKQCNCKAPVCRHTHPDLDDIQTFVAENAPDAWKDMIDCSKRINSLKDVLEYVRSEKVHVAAEFERADGVRKLVESIDAISAQLQKTVFESQQIIAGKGVKIPKPPVPYSRIEMSPRISGEISKDFLAESLPEDDEQIENDTVPRETQKPKIVSDERVHIPLERIRMLTKQAAVQKTIAESPVDHDEEIVKMLLNEILEQSKNVENVGLGKSGDAMSGTGSPRNEEHAVNKWEDEYPVNETSSSAPMLAGIPKVPQPRPRTQLKGPSRPPPSLVNHFGILQEFQQAHELSAITEMDTPDTGANKSRVSSRSPAKARRNVELQSRSTNSAPRVTDTEETRLSNERERTPRTPRRFSKKTSNGNVSAESMHSLPDVPLDQLHQSEAPEMHTLPDVPENEITQFEEEAATKNKMTSTSSTSFSGWSGISEITSSTSSDLRTFFASSPDLEKLVEYIGSWAQITLQKTREAYALSSSSNSDATPVNKRSIVLKRGVQENRLPNISDVSSISNRDGTHMSTERSLLVRGRTSTPIRRRPNDTNTDRSPSLSSLNFSAQHSDKNSKHKDDS